MVGQEEWEGVLRLLDWDMRWMSKLGTEIGNEENQSPTSSELAWPGLCCSSSVYDCQCGGEL